MILKFCTSIWFGISCIALLAQQPQITQIEGFLELYYPETADGFDVSSSIFIGLKSGQKCGGGLIGCANNTFVGSYSGLENDIGVFNTFLGSNTGANNTSGSFNTFLGTLAGSEIVTGSGNICIGFGAGPDGISSANSRLYIDVEQSNNPLIYGEFDTDRLFTFGRHIIRASPPGTNGLNLGNYPLFVHNDTTVAGGDVLALKTETAMPDSFTNYISFFGGNNLLGELQGNGSGGVEFVSSGADYAEMLPMLNPQEKIGPGMVVGVKEGKISLNTDDADQCMVVSSNPIVVGNASPRQGSDWHRVAFIGQVPVNILGAVQSGDYILASGLNDGNAIAVNPDQMSAKHLSQIIGRSWETNIDQGSKIINAVVGLDQSAAYENHLTDLQAEVDQLKALIEQISVSQN